jgi:hypothetical protein
VSVLINKTLSDFNFCNTVKHEQAVNSYKIHSTRLRRRREGGKKERSDMEGEGRGDRGTGERRSKIGKEIREVGGREEVRGR